MLSQIFLTKLHVAISCFLWVRKGSHPCLVYCCRGSVPLGSPRTQGRQNPAALAPCSCLSSLLSLAGDKERLCVKVLCVPVAGGQQGTLVTWPCWGLQIQPLDEAEG